MRNRPGERMPETRRLRTNFIGLSTEIVSQPEESVADRHKEDEKGVRRDVPTTPQRRHDQ